jgi:hypothetical protein
MARFDLTDFEWSVMQPLLPNKRRGIAHLDDRRVLNGIFWRLRTGAPWADTPERYGPHTTGVNRFNRWRRTLAWAVGCGCHDEAHGSPSPSSAHYALFQNDFAGGSGQSATGPRH